MRALLADRPGILAPRGVAERDDDILGEAEDLGGLADRRARAIGRHRRRETRALAPVALIDVLDHLFALLVLEIDVDVGRLVALGRDETLEQEIEFGGIDLGDPEAIADRRIGRRAAPLAQDAARLGVAHDVVHGEEIGRVFQVADQREFVIERLAHIGGNAVGIARPRARLGEGFERGLRRREAFAQLRGIIIGEIVEAEGKAGEEMDRLLRRLRRLGEQARHFGRPI